MWGQLKEYQSVSFSQVYISMQLARGREVRVRSKLGGRLEQVLSELEPGSAQSGPAIRF